MGRLARFALGELQGQRCSKTAIGAETPLTLPTCALHAGKLNVRSMLLEGSKQSSKCQRVRLDVERLENSASFYPGQIIGVLGVNSGGAKFVARKVVVPAPLPTPRMPSAALGTPVPSAGRVEQKEPSELLPADGIVHVWVAAGPFATHDSLEYAPLRVRVAMRTMV